MAEIRVWPAGDRGDLEQILRGEYDVPGLELSSPVVLDLGANIGCFTVWAAERFPGAQVFAYEPNPRAFSFLEQNAPDAVLRKCAVSNFDGKAPLFLGMHNLGEASLVNVGEQDMSKAGIVKVVHANKLPEADFVKIDTEGSERAIVEGYPHWPGVKGVALEWHSHTDREFFRSFFTAHGFQLVEDKEWHWSGRGVQKWKRTRRPHVFLGILCGGGETWLENRSCVDALMRLAPQCGIDVTVSWDSGTGVDRARNRLVAQARKEGKYTHFMFLDDDIIFDPRWVVGMVQSNLDIVAGAYPRKQINWEMVERAVKSGVAAKDLAKHATDWIINMVHGGEQNGRHFQGIGDFVEVEEVGTGFLMFKMAVVEAMLARWGKEMAYLTDYEPRDEVHHTLFACGSDPNCPKEQSRSAVLAAVAVCDFKSAAVKTLLDAVKAYQEQWADERTGLGRYLTEDYRWCRLARMLGHKIYIYLDASVGHLGTHCYEGAIKNYFGAVKCERCGAKPAAGAAPYSDFCLECANFMAANSDT